ncbi:DUF2019 domain-containing protein [bacterium]|nr:DUF2019 domain-containing protein [bacterium]
MVEDDVSKLVDEFAEAIIKQNQAIHSGTTKEVKHYGNKIGPTARKLLQKGEEAKRQFATLFSHPDREVRANAAFYLINSMPEEALAVYKELAQGDDLVALGAQMRVKEWEERQT